MDKNTNNHTKSPRRGPEKWGIEEKQVTLRKKTGCFAITEQPSSILIGMIRIVNIIIRNGITTCRELHLKPEERVSDNRKRVSDNRKRVSINRKRVSINRNVSLTIENVSETIGTRPPISEDQNRHDDK